MACCRLEEWWLRLRVWALIQRRLPPQAQSTEALQTKIIPSAPAKQLE